MARNANSFASGVAWNTVGSLVYSGANWLTTIFVVVLGEGLELSGDLAIAMAVGNLTATIALFNLRPVQVSDIDKAYSASQYLFFRSVTSVASSLLSVGYMVLTVPLSCYEVVGAYIAFKVADSFVDVFHGIDQCHERLDIVGKSLMIRGVSIIVIFSLVIELTNNLSLAVWLMFAMTLLVVLFFDVRTTSKMEPLSLSFADFRASLSLFRICLPGLLSMLLCTYVVTYARQFYGVNCGSEMLGIYAAISTPAVIVQLLAGYIYYPLIGPIAKFWKAGESGELMKLTGRFLICLVALMMACVAFFAIFGHSFFSLIYGDAVAAYSDISFLVVLCVGMTAFMIFMIDILVIVKMFKESLISCLAAAILAVALSPLVVDWAGMNGVSLTITFAYIGGCSFAAAALLRNMLLRKKKHGHYS